MELSLHGSQVNLLNFSKPAQWVGKNVLRSFREQTMWIAENWHGLGKIKNEKGKFFSISPLFGVTRG